MSFLDSSDLLSSNKTSSWEVSAFKMNKISKDFSLENNYFANDYWIPSKI